MILPTDIITEMKKIQFKGKLRHIMHGTDIVAHIIVAFKSEEEAKQISQSYLAQLGFVPFKTPTVLFWQGNRQGLNKIKDLFDAHRIGAPCNLFSCRNKKNKIFHPIDGIEHSIDYGPDFEVELEIS